MAFKSYSNLLVQNSNLCLNNENNPLYNTTLFTTPYSTSKDSCLYPTFLFPRIIIFAVPTGIIGSKLNYLLPAIFGVLSLFLIYLITLRLSKKQIIAIFALIIASSFPLLFHWSTLFYSDTFSLFAFLLITIILISNNLNYAKSLIVGIIYTITVLIRPSDIILIIPFLFLMKKNKEGYWKKVTYFLIPVFLGFLVILPLTNLHLFGDALFNLNQKNAYLLSENPYDIKYTPLDILKFYLKIEESNLNALTLNSLTTLNFILKFMPLILVCMLWFIPLVQKKDNKKIIRYIKFTVISFAILILYYGRGTLAYGLGRVSLQSSFLRYMLLAFILTIPLASFAFFEIIKKSKIKILIFSLLLIMLSASIYTMIYNYEDYGIAHTEKVRATTIDLHKSIEKEVGNSIVVADIVGFSILYPNIKEVIFIDYKFESILDQIIPLIININKTIYFVGAFYENSTYIEPNTNFLVKLNNTLQIEEVSNYYNDQLRVYKIEPHNNE